MEYKIPKSSFSEKATGRGSGIFQRTLNNKYFIYDYKASFSTGNNAAAHGIFAWDEKLKMYRYWWFEDSGSFDTATCNFINNKSLFMSWHGSLLIQTFTQMDENTVELRMKNPDKDGSFELVLEVIFKRK